MNQGNNTNMNNNGTDATVNTNVAQAPVSNTTPNGLNFASAPAVSTPVQQAPVQPQTQTPAPQQVAPVQTTVDPQTVVAPTQTVINTTKKKGSNIFLFIIIILIGVFIYYIDDALAYFNQNHSPVVDTTIKENASANLIDNKYIKLNEENSYIKLKGIKFNNVRKSAEDTVIISYASDKNYSNANSLNLIIELYDENKNVIYSEPFSVFGTIESGSTRQYKIKLKTEVYDKLFYATVYEKKEVVNNSTSTTEETTTEEEKTTTEETKVIKVVPSSKEDNNG